MRPLIILALCLFAGPAHARGPAAPPPPWCAAGMGSLPSGTCYSLPRGSTGLVLFLHGFIKSGTTWQHGQMLAAVSGVRGRNLAVMAPRGKTGMATGEFKDMIAWPTSHQAQQEHLASILAGFAADQRALERLNGAPFEKLYVVGFSNGAYFATSIVIHGRLRADGAAIFAGGSGKWINPRAARVRPRLFVGWGEDDKTKDDPIGLSEVLADAGWPHEAQGYEGVGHAMTMAQMKDAFDYLTGP